MAPQRGTFLLFLSAALIKVINYDGGQMKEYLFVSFSLQYLMSK